jgi:hypothetical protein
LRWACINAWSVADDGWIGKVNDFLVKL